jgi:WhiB family transcriptional regulator, redox-sensing transcriptional regulator
MKYAGCRNMSSDTFFPDKGNNLLGRSAIETCNRCPVQMDCLEYAIQNNLDHGIWGGTSERQRIRIRRARISSR